jgi:hypothetical protein
MGMQASESRHKTNSQRRSCQMRTNTNTQGSQSHAAATESNKEEGHQSWNVSVWPDAPWSTGNICLSGGRPMFPVEQWSL